MLDDQDFYKQALTPESQMDARLPVRFEWFDEKDAEETKKCGFPRFKRIQIIRTLIPGSRDERVDRVREEHKRRFPKQWAAFLAGEEGVVDGTPLREYPGLTKDDVSTLTHNHVLSVEQLASLSDENASNIGHNWRQRRDGAKAWLSARKSAQPVAELTAKLEEKDAQLAAMMERLAALEARDGQPALSEAPKAAPKKRGRPKKDQPPAATEG